MALRVGQRAGMSPERWRLEMPPARHDAARERQRTHSPAMRECIHPSHRRANGTAPLPLKAVLRKAVLAPTDEPPPPARGERAFTEKNERATARASHVGVAGTNRPKERQCVPIRAGKPEQDELPGDDAVQADVGD